MDDSGGADYSRIQDAVNAASAGDMILVRDGTYSENIDINKRLIVKPTPAKQTPVEQPATEQPTVILSAKNYIVDSKGNTIYLFARDIMGDSKCSGGCLNNWPIFNPEKIVVSSGLNSSDFGTIIRDDGMEQTTLSSHFTF